MNNRLLVLSNAYKEARKLRFFWNSHTPHVWVSVCMYEVHTLHSIQPGLGWSILSWEIRAIPVHYLIGKKTLQRSDGLTGYVESKQATAPRMASITITPRPANTTTSYYRIHHLNCHLQNESLLQTVLRRCLQPTNEQFAHRIPPAISHWPDSQASCPVVWNMSWVPPSAGLVIMMIRPSYWKQQDIYTCGKVKWQAWEWMYHILCFRKKRNVGWNCIPVFPRTWRQVNSVRWYHSRYHGRHQTM